MERRAWEKDLPRKQFQQFHKIEQSQSWFDVYDIGNDVYAIYEPYQFQEVISYLILGEEKALLWDTGNGIGSMKQLIDELWQKELIVVNSHLHFDHIGGNHEFECVHVLNHPYVKQVLEMGIDDTVYEEEYAESTYSVYSPLPYRPLHYHPFVYCWIEDGHIFDLGRRRLQVKTAPGHSVDSLVLVDEQKKLLFTGDTYYPATLYCFTEGMFETYTKTMQKLAGKYQDYLLITSHNEPLREGKMLQVVAKEFEKVMKCEVSFMMEHEYEKYELDGVTLLKR